MPRHPRSLRDAPPRTTPAHMGRPARPRGQTAPLGMGRPRTVRAAPGRTRRTMDRRGTLARAAADRGQHAPRPRHRPTARPPRRLARPVARTGQRTGRVRCALSGPRPAVTGRMGVGVGVAVRRWAGSSRGKLGCVARLVAPCPRMASAVAAGARRCCVAASWRAPSDRAAAAILARLAGCCLLADPPVDAVHPPAELPPMRRSVRWCVALGVTGRGRRAVRVSTPTPGGVRRCESRGGSLDRSPRSSMRTVLERSRGRPCALVHWRESRGCCVPWSAARECVGVVPLPCLAARASLESAAARRVAGRFRSRSEDPLMRRSRGGRRRCSLPLGFPGCSRRRSPFFAGSVLPRRPGDLV